ncbi:hypothetical protein HB816_08685 [Listeria booriae]|uniref:hypothetical protein n=1 Tax=Listeria booriae TaxID=1552123 RepID=UPI001623D80F|nr:hypothetical protein [Listeria booriae]MBC1230518.1 hypothetical protein [Listeria booriae]
MNEDNKVLKIGDEVRFTDIVTIVNIDTDGDIDNVEIMTDAGYKFWTTRDNLEK